MVYPKHFPNTVEHHSNLLFHYDFCMKSNLSYPVTYYINPKADNNILTRVQLKTHYDELPPFNTLNLLGYIFLHKHDDTRKRAEVNSFLKEVKFMV